MTNKNGWIGWLALGLVLSGCGGGGASDASGGVAAPQLAGAEAKLLSSSGFEQPTLSKPDATAINKPLYTGSVVDVGVGTVTPPLISATLYEFGVMPNALLTGTAVGDLALLSGKTLYVKIADPLGMYAYGIAAPTNNPAPGLLVVLQGKVLGAPGLFTGTMPVWLCVDANCSTKLRGMPYQMPYRVEVLRSFRPTKGVPGQAIATVQISSKFGEVAPAGQLRVTLPERAPFSSIGASVGYSPGWGYEAASLPSVTLVDNGDATMTMNATVPTMTPPGRRSITVTLLSSFRIGENSAPPAALVELVQVVEENPAVTVQFNPELLSFTSIAGSIQRTNVAFKAVSGKQFGALVYEDVEYLFTPEQEANFPTAARAATLRVSSTPVAQTALVQSASFSGCVSWVDAGGGVVDGCLAIGEYAFRLRYRHIVNGVSTTVYYPGRLQVVL